MSTGIALGLDIGTSFIKAAVIDESGEVVASSSAPDREAVIDSPHPGWAEQDPMKWWGAVESCLAQMKPNLASVQTIGITYQMHGLVLTDGNLAPTRPSIIWCDGRAAKEGSAIAEAIGEENCWRRLRNLPGNFTAAKLRWVARNEPETCARSRFAMLPGDFIATQLTGVPTTTDTGLSEGIFWDFEAGKLAEDVVAATGCPRSLIPEILPGFAEGVPISQTMADRFGLSGSARVTYRAGDQVAAAWGLGAQAAGDWAGNAGTSGVLYAVGAPDAIDKSGKSNAFLHPPASIGQLVCINGCGIAYRWLRQLMAGKSYDDLNRLAASSPQGSAGLLHFPFGNGPERILNLKPANAAWLGLDFNRHTEAHVARSVLEGIAYAMAYGASGLSTPVTRIRVGSGNLFESDVFARTIASLLGAPVEVVQTDGAASAARASVGQNRRLSPRTVHEPWAESHEIHDNFAHWRHLVDKLVV